MKSGTALSCMMLTWYLRMIITSTFVMNIIPSTWPVPWISFSTRKCLHLLSVDIFQLVDFLLESLVGTVKDTTFMNFLWVSFAAKISLEKDTLDQSMQS